MLNKKEKELLSACEEEHFYIDAGDIVLIYKDTKSYKFYIVGLDGVDPNQIAVLYGKMGASGIRKDYYYDTEEKKDKASRKLLTEKLAKGYVLKYGILPEGVKMITPKKKPIAKTVARKKTAPKFVSKEHEEKFNVFEEFLKI